jgi:hypothetical protein
MQMDMQEEGVRALEMMVEQLARVPGDFYRWKWVVIAAHNALQAFMAQAVAGSAQIGHMTNAYIRKWHEAYERGERPTTPPRVANFMDLFERVQSHQDMNRFVGSRKLEPTTEEQDSVSDLNYWRGEFVHYKEGALSIEVSGLPEILHDCLAVVHFLAFECGQVFHSEGELPERAKDALKNAEELLSEIEIAHDAE